MEAEDEIAVGNRLELVEPVEQVERVEGGDVVQIGRASCRERV